MVNENEPVKCKDCNIWWRGLEHKCKVELQGPSSNPAPKKPIYDRTKDKLGCPLCGATGPHYCTGKNYLQDKNRYQKYATTYKETKRLFPKGYTVMYCGICNAPFDSVDGYLTHIKVCKTI